MEYNHFLNKFTAFFVMSLTLFRKLTNETYTKVSGERRDHPGEPSVLNVSQQLHVEEIEPLLLTADQCIWRGEMVALGADPLHDHLLVVLLDDLADALDHLLQGELDLTSLETSHIVTL